MGQTIGFPTCNIDIKDYVLIKPGVYEVKVLRKNNPKFIKGIAILGYRPTFNQKIIELSNQISSNQTAMEQNNEKFNNQDEEIEKLKITLKIKALTVICL